MDKIMSHCERLSRVLPTPVIDLLDCTEEFQRKHIRQLMNSIITIKIVLQLVQILMSGGLEGMASLLVTLIPYISLNLAIRARVKVSACVMWFCATYWLLGTLVAFCSPVSLSQFMLHACVLMLLSQHLLGSKGVIGSFFCCMCSCVFLSHTYGAQKHSLEVVQALEIRLAASFGVFSEICPKREKGEFNAYDATHVLWDSMVSLSVACILQLLNEKAHRQAQKNIRQGAVHKSEFIARMSHELRTPLFGIVGCLEMLHISKVDVQQKSLLQMAETCAKSLMALIDDILDMSKIEVGKMEFDATLVETHKLIDESLSVVWALASKKGIKLRQVRNAELPHFFMGDRVRNRQVLINLLSNSVKFTPTNGTISLQAKRVSEIEMPHQGEHWYSPDLPVASTQGKKIDGYMMFKVKDTGIGLEPNEFKRIFKPFEQADVSVARSFGGTGLGLTISASLVAQMGGQFFASSRGKGLGATFQYFIPFIEPDPLSAPSTSSEDAPKPVIDRRRLLLAASRLSMPVLPTQSISKDKASLHAFIHSHISSSNETTPTGTPTHPTPHEAKKDENSVKLEKDPLKLDSYAVKVLDEFTRPHTAPPNYKRIPKAASISEIVRKSSVPEKGELCYSKIDHKAPTAGNHGQTPRQYGANRNPRSASLSPTVYPSCVQRASSVSNCIFGTFHPPDHIDPHESILDGSSEPIKRNFLKFSLASSNEFGSPFIPAGLVEAHMESMAQQQRRRESLGEVATSAESNVGESAAHAMPSNPEAYLRHLQSVTDEMKEAQSRKVVAGQPKAGLNLTEAPKPLKALKSPPCSSPSASDICTPRIKDKAAFQSQLAPTDRNFLSRGPYASHSSVVPVSSVSTPSRSEPPHPALLEAMEASEKIQPFPKIIVPTNVADSPVSILVAEDNTINQRILELMLARLDRQCHLAANGLEVLKRIEQQSYDLILMDIEMPELSGLETTKRIRELGLTTPIIALSAHVLTEAKESALEAGMDQFISKPVNIDTLRCVLEKWLPQ